MVGKELKKTFLFGYSKSSVHDMISDLTFTNQRLVDQIDKQETTIETLKEKLARYESKDVLVSEVLVEAKHVAKKMIKEAHEEVAVIRHDTQQEINSKMTHFHTRIAMIEAIKSDIVNQEVALRSELKAVIQKYQEYIETMDITILTELANQVEQNLQAIATVQATEMVPTEEANNSKKIVEFQLKAKESLEEDWLTTEQWS